jgi:hypothetical protein
MRHQAIDIGAEEEERKKEELLINRTSLFPNNTYICPPRANRNNAFPLNALTNRALKPELNKLVLHLAKEVPRQKKDHRATVLLTFRTLLKNFENCWLSRRWVSIQGANAAFSNDGIYGRLGLGRNINRECLALLSDLGYVIKSEYNFQAKQTALYYPNDQLQKIFLNSLYSTYTGEQSCGIFIREKHLLRAHLPEDHPELIAINALHDHLKDQKLPLYSPLRVIYKLLPVGHFAINSGRLYTNSQSIPMRGNPIRSMTTINNLNCCEIDLSANHLRMAAALFGLELSDDPYQEIHKVKQVISALISTTENHTNLAIYSLSNPKDCQHNVVTQKTFLRIQDAAYKVFGWLKKARGIGINLQSLEGQILMDSMLKLQKEGITTIPIHGSLRVPIEFSETTARLLKGTWSEHMRVNFEPKVSIKF